ncbi:MAG: ABC transporter ATP-binding protein [Candidatus Methanoperedens sp.]|nr:ABC transporter ATP-binding protein [Candidatus Methanoperedens sp.]MCE8424507.1 ABC transporter ATP-binding protein [Candidatus Methanoperedens sp.]MCE8426951.1 ABC transporter ATP-binding protein [Candidatus Methanoperedens sp.]
MMKTLMELQGVWKIYRMGGTDVPALAGIDLTIKENEFTAITGPSGCGKSTMLNMIGCLDMPTRGKILLEGKDVSELKSNDLARIRGKKIGFIFQTFNLYPTLTALENIQLPMKIHEFSEKKIEDTSTKLLVTVGLAERGAHFPAQLSGGQQQRVAVARALSTSPSILLADEPTGNLDTKSGGEVMDVFKRLNSEGLTIVMITHDPRIAGYAERIVKMLDGKIVGET